jgi:hypothetical protein
MAGPISVGKARGYQDEETKEVREEERIQAGKDVLVHSCRGMLSDVNSKKVAVAEGGKSYESA